MPRLIPVGATLLTALATAACVETVSAGRGSLLAATGLVGVDPKEQTIRAWVPEFGYVHGTPEALASLGQPLQAAPGPNRTVEACRAAAQVEAGKLGASSVEAASAGPHRRTAKGQYVAPVRMRITYVRPDGYEVRLSTMTCTVDGRNRLVAASS